MRTNSYSLSLQKVCPSLATIERIAVAIALGSSLLSAQPPQRPAGSTNTGPRELTRRQAFFYVLAQYGPGLYYNREWLPMDVVDQYGESFEPNQFKTAMADEFARARYRSATRAVIDRELARVRFGEERFSLVQSARLGEYSFGDHAFPVQGLADRPVDFSLSGYRGMDAFVSEGAKLWVWRDAVNGVGSNVAMADKDADSFIKSRARGPGQVDRGVVVKFIYTVVRKRSHTLNSYRLFPFVISADVFADSTLRVRLGSLSRDVAVTSGVEWQRLVDSSRVPGAEIARFEYVRQWRQGAPIAGTLSLDAAGLEWGREADKSGPQRLFFVELFERAVEFGSSTTACGEMFGRDAAPECAKGSAFGVWRVDRSSGSRARFIVRGPFLGDGVVEFIDHRERDKFFIDFVSAAREWARRFPKLAPVPFWVPENCYQDNGSTQWRVCTP